MAASILLQAALSYAAQGIPVFPCKADKKPYTAHGFKDATTDEQQIRAWWAQWPGANVGIPTGPVSNLFVIDCDTYRDEEFSSIDKLQADLGDLPETQSVVTGSGGVHLCFNYPAGHSLRNTARLKNYPGLDIRGDGGYVLAPPSHNGNGPYVWLNEGPRADLPPAYIDFFETKAKAPPQPTQPEYVRPAQEDDGPFWLDRAMQRASVGNRNETGHWLACQYRDTGMSQAEAEGWLRRYAQFVDRADNPYTVDEALQSLKSAYARAPREPARSQHRQTFDIGRTQPDPEGNEERTETSPPPPTKETQAQELIRLAGLGTCFRTPGGAPYIRVPVKGHLETWGIDERGGFRNWLTKYYFEIHKSAPSTTALATAIDYCRAAAQYSDLVMPVFTRIGSHDGNLYLDLADDTWRAIEITPDGWRIVDQPPVAFRRPRSMRPLTVPERGGSLEELRTLINIDDEDDWRLIVAWLLGALHPTGPYPVLCIHGEHGAAKTSTTRFLRAIIDPAVAPTRTAPKEERDLAITANNAWILALENLSHMPAWLSDALCRLATGGGFATRALYANDEETVFEATRPVVLNGIEEIVTRGDLISRAIVVTLPAIPEHQRMPESILNRRFEAMRPRILGALLDAACAALRNEPGVTLDELPRMADFARWVTAAEPHLGWTSGAFIEAYAENRANAIGTELEAPLPMAIQAIMSDSEHLTLTPAELLDYLQPHQPADADSKFSTWPRNARALSGHLKRHAPALRAVGIAIDIRKKNGVRTIELKKFDPHPEGGKNGNLGQVFRDANVTQRDANVTQRDANRDAKFSPFGAFSPDASGDPAFSGTQGTQNSPLSSVEEKKEREKGEKIEDTGKFASLPSLASLPPSGPSWDCGFANEGAAPRSTFMDRLKRLMATGLSEDVAIKRILAENERMEAQG